LEIHRCKFEDLTEEERRFQPDNGSGKLDANYIKLTDKGETVTILSDAVEPEDATFVRDFSDVLDAIETAYEIGVKDGRNYKEDE